MNEKIEFENSETKIFRNFQELMIPADISWVFWSFFSLKSCKSMDSKMKPLWLVWNNTDGTSTDKVLIMFKKGDGKYALAS